MISNCRSGSALNLGARCLSELCGRLVRLSIESSLAIAEFRVTDHFSQQWNLGFNRSMQHIKSCVSRRSVADEAETENLLHG